MSAAPTPVHTEVSRIVATGIRAALTAQPHPRVGPFTLVLDPSDDNVWRNYAVPDDGAEPTAAQVAELVAAFTGQGRTPRLEYVPAAAPAVEPALCRAGFTVQGRPPLMACRPGQVTGPPAVPGITIALVSSRDDLRATATVQNEAYGGPVPVPDTDVDRLARAISAGGQVALARTAGTGDLARTAGTGDVARAAGTGDLARAAGRGEPAGAGQVSAPVAGISELAAVGVRPGFRRRGIAAALTRVLARAGHDQGAELVWLEPAGVAEARIYQRAGFTASGTKLWISLPG